MSARPIERYTVVIPAGSAANPCAITKQSPGAFFLCRSASAPFQMQFDAGTPFDCEQGFQTGGRIGSFRTITFFNVNSYPITVRYYCGADGVGFSGTILAQNLPTYGLANLGLTADSGYYTHGTVKTGRRFSIPDGEIVSVPGLNAGNSRKQIFVSVLSPTNGQDAGKICDSAGNSMLDLQRLTIITLETAADLKIVSTVNNLVVVIGELYYSA